MTKDKSNNASYRKKLDPISKNIIRRQNPLELVFEGISTFDAENPIVGSLLKELDLGKKDIAGEVIKKHQDHQEWTLPSDKDYKNWKIDQN